MRSIPHVLLILKKSCFMEDFSVLCDDDENVASFLHYR